MQNNNLHRLRLSGPLSIPHAEAIQASILAAFEKDGSVILDIEPDAEVDISFLQILIAAQKTATARGIALSVSYSGDAIADQINRCGLAATSATGIRILPAFISEPAS